MVRYASVLPTTQLKFFLKTADVHHNAPYLKAIWNEQSMSRIYRISKQISVLLQYPPSNQSSWARMKEFLKDIGPPLTGIASVAIAFLVFYFGNQINERQIELQKEQLKTQQSQALTADRDLQLKILGEFNNSLNDLSSTDKKTRTLAAIRFVQYEKNALPAIKPALGAGEDAVRRGAVSLVTQLFQSEAVSREEWLNSLLKQFDTRNTFMRIGVLESFIELDRRLFPDEAKKITQWFTEQLRPDSSCSTQEEDELFRQAAVFLGLWPSVESSNLLLAVASNRSCLRARIQAVDNLPKMTPVLSPDQRRTLTDDLQALMGDAPETLKERIVYAINNIEASQAP